MSNEKEPKNESNEKSGKEEGEISPYEGERDFNRMIDRFQNDFENFFEGMPRWRSWMRDFPMLPSRRMMMPSVDLEDRGKDYRVIADLPGFNKEDVDIEVTDDSLVIAAKRTKAQEEKNKNYIRQERTAQTFYRRLVLPEPVKSDEANAKLNNGILEIILPKKAPKERKKLTVT